MSIQKSKVLVRAWQGDNVDVLVNNAGANSGGAAILQFQHHAIDLAITDPRMPR